QKSADALLLAYHARRPLLVRGEPGTGKSQLARAAACLLKRAFVPTVVHARTEVQDLHWRFDAVARLGEAQAIAALGHADVDVRAELAPHRYIQPGPIWWAFDWNDAQRQLDDSKIKGLVPEKPADWQPTQGCVLLIDEIDKAESDLPNGLLETLGNGAFSVDYLDRPIGQQANAPAPLVVITTNEERELPGAFLRRCVVLHLALPDKKNELESFLVQRGRAHFPGKLADPVLEMAAEMVADARGKVGTDGPLPGQAEYLDLLRALHEAHEGDTEPQLDLLKRVADFALRKQP
ncbi:MAG: AAA family ATPase, partial [Gammaproteobacteria bacterium]